MSAPERRPPAAPRPASVDLALALGLWLALAAAMMPLLRVVDPGTWVAGGVGLIGVVLGVGFALRRLRLPAIVVSIVELVVWVAVVTAVFGRGTGFLGVVPTPETFSLVNVLVRTAVDDVTLGAAPLEAGAALSFLIVASIGLLAIALDHVVVTARMPLLAAVGVIAVSIIPSIAVPGDVDIIAFVFLAGSILFLLAVDTRARQRAAAAAASPAPAGATRRSPVAPGAALGIGAVAVIVAMVAAPLLPSPVARAGGSGGTIGGATIDPTLELGDDLRQPGAVEVLRVRTTEARAPYLRVATLSEFDGAVWQPDGGDAVGLDDAASDLAAVTVDEGIEMVDSSTSVDIVNLNSRWAPVSYPATDVSGLDGEWSIQTDNRTVDTPSGSVQGQSYDVSASLPRPTLEQIRARSAGGTDDLALYDLPDEIPSVIAETAQEVTADTRSDYDALVALQSWFRGPLFGYSLDAPVSDGFDGTGVDAIADFLDARRGYCVHFASAFAVMARTLGMPSRIVVGYLPGTSAGTQDDGETVYSVESTQLHAWPEVHFEGVGWIAFEPTNSLGSPTNFASGTTGAPGSVPTTAPSAPVPTATPTPTSSAGLDPLDDQDGTSAGRGGSAASVALWPLAASLALLLVLAAPGVTREVRRRRLLSAAGRGEATAAWVSVQELAIDLGIPAPASESPRVFGARLLDDGADAAAVATLVGAIERVSYADDHRTADGARWADAVESTRASLLGAASPLRRFFARVLPRSLVIRPGSAFASGRTRPPRETTA